MKKILLCSVLAAASVPASAAVVFVDLHNVAIPFEDTEGLEGYEGIYINILTGATATVLPGDFNTAPWLNLFLGGTAIANSDFLRPWASQAPGDYVPGEDGHYFLNLAQGSVIDENGLFVPGESVSIGHVGAAPDQFTSGNAGFLAFAYKTSGGGDDAYGWLSFTPNVNGPGFSVDLAYSDSPGEAITVGAIPEPSVYAALAGVLALGAVVLRRRI